MKKLPRKFYERNTLTVARELLGKYLVHNSKEGRTAGKIVEVEAYIGPHDRASHAYQNKRTRRTEIQFGRGGFSYIYSIYGKNICFCVVTQKPGRPEVVLVRALEPIEGIKLMARRRNIKNISEKTIKNLTNGPSKLCQAMGISKLMYGTDLCGDELFIADTETNENLNITTTPRINIDYAEESKNYPWRFIIRGNGFVSKRV